MEMSQMLDVVHYLFEEDARFSSAEEAQAVSEFRATIYGLLYGTTYKYRTKASLGSTTGGGTADGGVKPYIPPTDFDPDMGLPFGSTLDAPFG